MKVKHTPIAAAVALTLMSTAVSVYAQEAEQKPSEKREAAQQLDAVMVTGIRKAQETAVNTKKRNSLRVDVVTAEDVGKMPDKNIADSLARVPGVSTNTASAGEGGFDERDRISLRGTSPSLTQIQIDGHTIGSGDWFILSQTGAAGRSVSTSLFDSGIISRLLVKKSSEAALVEGGTSGSVDVILRKPLEFKKQLEAHAAVGLVYSDLPKKTDPTLSALVAWKNDSKTFGAMVQAFYERRNLRRDGVETLGYTKVDASKITANAAEQAKFKDGIYVPNAIGAALFEQERTRKGGLVSLQFKPSSEAEFVLSGFTASLEAPNYNHNWLLTPLTTVNAGSLPTSYTTATSKGITTLTSAQFAAKDGVKVAEMDPISRPKSSSGSNFINLDGKIKASDNLTLTTKLGSANGYGRTLSQDVYQINRNGVSSSYNFNGIGSAPSFTIGSNGFDKMGGLNADGTANVNNGWVYDWTWGAQNVSVEDREDWLHLDGEYDIGSGALQSVKFGARWAKHERGTVGDTVAQGPACSDTGTVTWGDKYNCNSDAVSPFNPKNYMVPSLSYPSNFGTGLGGSLPSGIQYYSADQLAANNAAFANRNPVTRRFREWDFNVQEEVSAGYGQLNFESGALSGNVGLRVVKTKTSATSWSYAGATCKADTNSTSAFGGMCTRTVERNYTDTLPSLNLKFDLDKQQLVRVSASKTMTRPDFSVMAANVSLTPPKTKTDIGSGSAGNPYLDPVRSNNFDLNYEYYFAPRAFASAGVFLQNLSSYIVPGNRRDTFPTEFGTGASVEIANVQYDLTSQVNTTATVRGLELASEYPIGANFGVSGNVTFTNAKDSAGNELAGAAKRSYTLGGFFDNDVINARLTYSGRSDMFVTLDRNTKQYQMAGGVLSASVGYKVSDNLSVSLDLNNLNDPTLKYYGDTKDQPRGIYKNGRQYYLTVRGKL